MAKNKNNHFNQKLSYRYYDSETGIFHNDDSIGFMLELNVLAGANEQLIKQLASFLADKAPEGKDWNYGFSMISSQYVGNILRKNLESYRNESGEIPNSALLEYDFIKNHAISGFKSNMGLPTVLRDYRSFVFMSTRKVSHMKRLLALMSDVVILFKSIGASYKFLDACELVYYLRFILNNDYNAIDPTEFKYQKLKYISEQALSGDTTLYADSRYIDIAFDKIGRYEKKYRAVGLTVRGLPHQMVLHRMPDLFADITKPSNAMATPFILTLNFDINPLAQSKATSSRKLATKRRTSNSKMRDWFPTIDDDVAEWTEIVKGQETGEYKTADITMDMIILSDEDNYQQHTESCIGSFVAKGFTLRVNEELQFLTLFNTLPFLKHQMKVASVQAAQTHKVTTMNVANMLPIVADYKGSHERSGLMLPTFMNQIFFLNNFITRADNFNMCISAYSGAGKSVFMQAMMDNHLNRGGSIYMIDKGYSSYQYGQVNNACYLQAKDISINPFGYISEKSEGMSDLEHQEYVRSSNAQIKDLLSVMVSPTDRLTQIQDDALLSAVYSARQEKNTQAQIDDVIAHLEISHAKNINNPDIASDISKIIFSLKTKYSVKHKGTHAEIFNSKSQLGDDNPLTILELEGFESEEDLLKVVVFALMVVIKEKMYQGDRSQPKLAIIEEAWKLIGDSSPQTANFIECGFRTARKFNGGFVIVTQTMNDFYTSKAAQAAWDNTGVQIIMRQSPKFDEFLKSERGVIFSEAEGEMIKSFQKADLAGFSSIMIKAGDVVTVNRLFLDPYKRILLTTYAEHVSLVDKLVADGYSMETAVYLVANDVYGDEMTQGMHDYFRPKVDQEIQKLEQMEKEKHEKNNHCLVDGI
jgi:conjugal transfer ATP-binding protein TraC